jgi:hypothetical protein
MPSPPHACFLNYLFALSTPVNDVLSQLTVALPHSATCQRSCPCIGPHCVSCVRGRQGVDPEAGKELQPWQRHRGGRLLRGRAEAAAHYPCSLDSSGTRCCCSSCCRTLCWCWEVVQVCCMCPKRQCVWLGSSFVCVHPHWSNTRISLVNLADGVACWSCA